jgi:carbamoyltransferase
MKSNKIIGFQSGHDVSYCILENGVPIVHEELERFIREKEPLGDGLEMALQRIPKSELKDIGFFAYGNPGGREGSYQPTCGKKEADNKMRTLISNNEGQYFVIGHHQSHAANTFFSNFFNEALIITIDGSGPEKHDYTDTTKNTGDFHAAFTFWEGKDNKIKPILRIPTHQLSLGSPWRKYTKQIFKLSSGHPHGLAAGTIMAMASVGDPQKYYKDFYDAFKKGGNSLVLQNCSKYSKIAEISEQEKFDIAAGIQKATELVAYETIKPIIDKYKPENICFSGGVILNSVMMGKMYDWFGINNMYVCPVPYDGGLAIGSAQYVWHQVLNNPRIRWEDDCPSYMGVTYSKEEVINSLNRNDLSYIETTDDNVLDLLDQQNIISIFHGGAESGRRALGNRSIIADPRSPKMKDLINEKVKHRQWFRPFAPSILREDVKNWFTRDIESPYMSFVLPFKDEVKDKVPAVVHLDGTGRLQTVTEKNNKWYYNFIRKWKTKTGVPIILNTSFNDREPIVETPEHAVNCFMGTNIDYLYFSDYNILVSKK